MDEARPKHFSQNRCLQLYIDSRRPCSLCSSVFPAVVQEATRSQPPRPQRAPAPRQTSPAPLRHRILVLERAALKAPALMGLFQSINSATLTATSRTSLYIL